MKRCCISGAKAAEILGCDRHTLKQRIKSGVWKFGEIIPKTRSGKSRDSIVIWVSKLEAHIGREIDAG